MVFLKVIAVGPGLVIITVDPRPTDQLDKVLVAMIVLGKHNEVVTTTVAMLFILVSLGTSRHIHLATKDRLEWLQTFLLPALVDITAIVKKLFYPDFY